MEKYGWNFYFAQMLSGMALYFFITGWHKKEHKKILTYQVFSSIFNIAGFLFLNAYSGAILSSITMARNLLFRQREKFYWVQSNKIIFFFMTILMIGTVLTWKGYITLLPATASLFGTYSVSRSNPTEMRKYMLAGVVLWIPYNFYVEAYIASIGSIIMTVSLISAIIKNYQNQKEFNNIARE